MCLGCFFHLFSMNEDDMYSWATHSLRLRLHLTIYSDLIHKSDIIKREAGKSILNTYSKTVSAIFYACKAMVAK